MAVVFASHHAWRGGGVEVHSGTCVQRGHTVFGINDDNAFRYHYRGSAQLLAGLDDVQLGVWTSPDDHSFWPIPQTRGVLVQLLGSPPWVAGKPGSCGPDGSPKPAFGAFARAVGRR